MSTALTSHARLTQATDRVHALKGEAAAVLYQLGCVLREVDEGELWRAGGFASFSAWLDDGAQVTRGTAYRAMNVSHHFNEEISVRYGFDKLYLGLRYMELTRQVEAPGDLIAADLKVRGANGRFTSVPFHTATIRQIQDAIEVAGARRHTRSSGDESLDTRLSRLSAALPPVPSGLSPAKQRVELSRAKSGELALTFRQIPLKELAAFVAALQAELQEELDVDLQAETGEG